MVRIKQHKVRAVFIHIPKTGGTTVSGCIRQLFESEAANLVNGKQAVHLPIKFIDTQGAPTFAFVRDPVKWYESCWKMLCDMVDFKKFRARGWAPMGMAGFMFDKDFNKFIRNVLEHAPDYYIEVLKWYLGENFDKVDYIGRTETLNKDLNVALTLLGFQYDENKVLYAKTQGNRSKQFSWDESLKSEIIDANKEFNKIKPNL